MSQSSLSSVCTDHPDRCFTRPLGGWSWELGCPSCLGATPPSPRNQDPACQALLPCDPGLSPPGHPQSPQCGFLSTHPGIWTLPGLCGGFARQPVCSVLRSIARKCCEIRFWH